jgi:hypothetical protein
MFLGVKKFSRILADLKGKNLCSENHARRHRSNYNSRENRPEPTDKHIVCSPLEAQLAHERFYLVRYARQHFSLNVRQDYLYFGIET